MSPAPDLAALLASRICHDLISPIGAISNGLELLSMSEGNAKGPEMTLIGDSVTQANARICLFRIAFGIAASGQVTGRRELVSILSDLTVGLRLRVDWDIPDEVSRAEAKLAILCLMCLETAMPFGGQIRIVARQGAWQVAGDSMKLRVDPDLWRAFADGTLQVSAPAQVQFGFAREQARRMGRALAVEQGRDRLSLSF